MKIKKQKLITGLLFCLLFPFMIYSQHVDSTIVYDPFGPENSPDHNGQGSGGVITPSPYEGIIQKNFTRISADYNGIQFMLDCPIQIAPGLSWSSETGDMYGVLFKLRGTGIRSEHFDKVLNTNVPYYHLPFEISFEYSIDDKSFPAVKFNLNYESYTKSLGMAGIGVVVSEFNLTASRDIYMDRKIDAELTWIQVAGGYTMPLSPNVGGINIALCGAVDLLGAKSLFYNSDETVFYGAKIGSAGWLTGIGWNALSLLNVSVYVGGEWSFSTGAVKLPTEKVIRADIGRNTLYSGVQLTGRYFNIVGGIQKEWEYLDYLRVIRTEKIIRYYFGANYYFRR